MPQAGHIRINCIQSPDIPTGYRAAPDSKHLPRVIHHEDHTGSCCKSDIADWSIGRRHVLRWAEIAPKWDFVVGTLELSGRLAPIGGIFGGAATPHYHIMVVALSGMPARRDFAGNQQGAVTGLDRTEVHGRGPG